MLLALVFGVVLVLVGVTASALAALVSAHLSSARLNTVVANDAALVGFFVNDKLLASDVDDDGPTAGRAATLSGELGHLIGDGGIVRIEIRNPDGRVIASDDLSAVGQRAAASAGATAALAGRPSAALIEAGGAFEAVGDPLGVASVVQEYLPIVEDGRAIGIISMRDLLDLSSKVLRHQGDAAARELLEAVDVGAPDRV